MKKINVKVNSVSGLHARPASLVVNTANKYSSNISIKKGDKTINCKSIMGVLSIGADKGDELVIITEGEDEVEAIYDLEDLFVNQLVNE
ncbi:HPr family phosphocarrier protein [Dethiothermospora halolimnae]|uniref:HPr family phosphocarrier protein n=1 Tax=Dethiothermospora halolimnae TaxID=3114390 RepID=UPI003CCBEDAA